MEKYRKVEEKIPYIKNILEEGILFIKNYEREYSFYISHGIETYLIGKVLEKAFNLSDSTICYLIYKVLPKTKPFKVIKNFIVYIKDPAFSPLLFYLFEEAKIHMKKFKGDLVSINGRIIKNISKSSRFKVVFPSDEFTGRIFSFSLTLSPLALRIFYNFLENSLYFTIEKKGNRTYAYSFRSLIENIDSKKEISEFLQRLKYSL